MSGEATTRQQNQGSEGQSDPARRVNPVPDGFRTVTPYLIVSDVPNLVDFLKRVFDAEETNRSTGGSGGGIHSEVRIGNSMLMIGGGGPGLSWKGVSAPTAFHVYVDDTDAVYNRALDAGATPIVPVTHHEYGERSGSVIDPFGNHWYIAFPTYLGEKYTPDAVQTLQVFL